MLANLVASHAETGLEEISTPVAAAWAGTEPDRVLIAEDDEVIANLLALILSRAGYQPLRARTAAQALLLFERERDRIAIALIDLTLPDIDGMILGQHLRRQSETLPLLFTSGRDMTALHARFDGDTRTGFLRKPFFPPDVLRAVRQLVEVPA